MSAYTNVVAAAGRRLTGLDPLLPAQSAPPDGCGATFTAAGSDGDLAAVAGCAHWTDEPGALSLTWGAARRFHLHPRIGGAPVGSALDHLITQWRDHLAGIPEAAEEDSAAMVTWPSRDVEGIRVLQRHNLAPFAVIAARVARTERAAEQEQPDDGIRIRRAGPPTSKRSPISGWNSSGTTPGSARWSSGREPGKACGTGRPSCSPIRRPGRG